ncbi:hypothetical protein GF351_00070 [Candidatus Woesearchaeota archaeon]|nr:hypothetical protein [Candidatus Woesearchaeota archaeon]
MAEFNLTRVVKDAAEYVRKYEGQPKNLAKHRNYAIIGGTGMVATGLMDGPQPVTTVVSVGMAAVNGYMALKDAGLI